MLQYSPWRTTVQLLVDYQKGAVTGYLMLCGKAVSLPPPSQYSKRITGHERAELTLSYIILSTRAELHMNLSSHLCITVDAEQEDGMPGQPSMHSIRNAGKQYNREHTITRQRPGMATLEWSPSTAGHLTISLNFILRHDMTHLNNKDIGSSLLQYRSSKRSWIP